MKLYERKTVKQFVNIQTIRGMFAHAPLFLFVLMLSLPMSAQQNDASKTKQTETDHLFSVAKNLDVFNTIYGALELYYVDSLDANKVIRTGIDAMLDQLDPYTEYYPEEDMETLKMMTTGKYGGIGSMIRLRKDSTVMIGEPYAGMPAAEVGLKVGDVLLSIDGTDLKGKGVSDVSDMLRGEPGTSFKLRVQRPGEKKPREFKLTRRSIKLPDIPYYGMLEGNGYINLSSFTDECSANVRKAVVALKQQGAKGIILDLRDNGGGLLNEATQIVNLFVPKGKMIVQTKGKAASVQSSYATDKQPLDTITPIVVLVNGNTASAAEIVSGSLQDFDRAVIVGTKTFGKGLVQSPRELPYGGSLKLTTAKYYIPSGRCIQRIDYKKSREEGKKTNVATDSLHNIFYTEHGRKVYGGGGITPDIEVKRDTMQNILFYLTNDDVLVDYGTQYCNTHPAPSSVAAFTITDADFNEFKEMAIKSGFKYDRLSDKRLNDLKEMAKFEGYYDDTKEEFAALEAKLQHNLGKDFDKFKKEIKQIMAQEIVKRYFYQSGSIQEELKDDPELKRAQQILASPEEYRNILKAE